MVWLVDVTPPIAYPVLYWVTFLAVLREGWGGARAEAGGAPGRTEADGAPGRTEAAPA
jgi:hypothetical protein